MNTPPPTAAVVSPSRTTYQAILSQRWRLRHSATAQPGSNTPEASISHRGSRLSLAGLFQLEFYARGMAVPVERYKASPKWNESDHPRDEDGQFVSAEKHEIGYTTKKGEQKTRSEWRLPGGGELPPHFEGKKLPPAWSDVQISLDPKAKILARGTDVKGRKQAVYSSEHTKKQAAAKFARVSEGIQKFGQMQDQNKQNLATGDQKTREAAAAQRLIMHTGIRPGSERDTGAKVQAYGATTLLGSHVTTEEGTGRVVLKFTGKKGVSLEIPVEDREIAADLIARKSRVGDAGQLFSISDSDMRNYSHTLDGGGFKTKDFRTIIGTSTAMALVESMPKPKTEKDRKAAIKYVATIVSKKLGNTPTIALQSYIDPHVFEGWKVEEENATEKFSRKDLGNRLAERVGRAVRSRPGRRTASGDAARCGGSAGIRPVGVGGIERYGEGWVTIGGGPGPGGRKHIGGTPVAFGPGGKVEKGPSSLVGKSLPTKQQTTLFNAISPNKREKKPGTGPPKREQETLFDKGKPEEKSATPEPPANPYVVRNADGRNVGMALLPIDQVQADPTAFQYKFSEVTDKTTGTTAELKDVKQFNPLYAGQMLVWDDGEGNTFVVNGHHRYELAKRSGYTGPLNVQYIDATDVHEAKAIGALANIAEGKGTAIDAAKFLRDTKRSVADIVESGISLKGKVAADAQHLVNASNNVWRELEMGYLPEDKALIITRALPDDHDSQNKLLKRLNVRDSKRLMGNGILQEAADAMAAAPVVKKDGGGLLFGSDEDEERLWEQRATAADHVKRMMSEEKMAWKGVSKEGRAETVAAAGNVLQLPENQRRAQEAAAAEMMFNQLKNRKGPLAEVLNDAAKQLHENPRRKKSILKELEERARAAIAEIQGDFAGSVQGTGKKDDGDSGKSEGSGGGGSGASAEQLKVAAGTELFAKQWEEGKHPRADDGKFGEGGTKKPKTKPRSRKPIPETVPLPSGFIEDNESTWKDAGFIAPDGSLLGKQGRHRDMLAKLGCTGRPGYEGNTAEIAGKYGLVRATTFGFKELSVQVFGRPLTRHQLEVIEDAVQRRPDLTLEVVDFKGKMKDWKMWKADPPTAQQIGQFINSTLGVDETESFSRCGIIHRYTLPHHAYRLLADQLNHRVKYNKDLQFVVEEPDKMTPTEANYRSGFGVVTCRGCDHYRDGGTCSEVSGDVRVFDVCDLWKSKRKAAS